MDTASHVHESLHLDNKDTIHFHQSRFSRNNRLLTLLVFLTYVQNGFIDGTSMKQASTCIERRSKHVNDSRLRLKLAEY